MWRTIGVLVVGCANVGRWVDEEMEESNVWKGIGWFMKGWAGQWMVAKPQVLVGFASLWHRTGVVCCSEKWNELDEKLEIFEKMERNFEDNRWPRQFLMLRCYEKNPVRGILVNRQAAWEFRIEYVRVAWLSHSTHYWPPALFIFLQCVFYHPPISSKVRWVSLRTSSVSYYMGRELTQTNALYIEMVCEEKFSKEESICPVSKALSGDACLFSWAPFLISLPEVTPFLAQPQRKGIC